ncbi:MAG: DNA-directed RNA polymerase subunit beta' [SAR202 cluster bacterium]|nr:DNA-directed RNA polymerase subunit beta' [SAR202 cluster bacterium]|tara:strand:+ start:10047 stop:14054 length:4008 start_codon:yes stop_codon:yes gene_type:complete
MTQTQEFNAIRISLASPEQIKNWSYGEVTKPETINYRTLRPEKDGLFCERIFGPTKDWECFCGKYKKIRYKGVICDRCGVEVARAKVRRERMGHIELAAPVTHVWFSKGVPSRLGLLLDITPRNLERVLYFAKYIVTSVDEDKRLNLISSLEEILNSNNQQNSIEVDIDESAEVVQEEIQDLTEDGTEGIEESVPDNEIEQAGDSTEDIDPQDIQDRIDYLEWLKPFQLLTESQFRDMRDKFEGVFRASMGAEGILEILKGIDLESLKDELHEEIEVTSGQRRKKAIKRLRVVEALAKSCNQPDWMVLTTLPVLPPELRPMVQLDGGRFATSDLNDLYRRVINRNNRLKRLMELGAPEIIIRNEKRMLQEAVDALIDNGRIGKAISGTHNQKLKSLADLLRGKQGRFRQNLLGKRVDYSGRSVIVVGPDMSLDQCGLPKKMALELFKPFVMNRLILQGHVSNIKSAKRMVERVRPEVWDILEEVIKTRPVLLNRAPTLHRLGIQAFQPTLVEGSAIKLHPLVCAAFNADFDGDQMAVHVPLSKEAVLEARRLMLSTQNMLSPSSGEPIVAPTLDMVFGCYYLTSINEPKDPEYKALSFTTFEEALIAYENALVDLRSPINVRIEVGSEGVFDWVVTTVGRIIFNEVLPEDIQYRNQIMDKNALKEIAAECYRLYGNDKTANVLDSIKRIGFHYASKSGTTIAINDIKVPAQKEGLIDEATDKVDALEEQYQLGLITEDERYNTAVRIWTDTSDQMTKLIEDQLPTYGGVYLMAISGAKGNIAQIKQMAGMRGLMANPRGRIIDLPIKSSFREGLSVLEYFISTHGARKGLADTALRTADSGYLTRRLIDVSQEVIILEDDCGTTMGITIYDQADMPLISPMAERILGRIAVDHIVEPATGEILVEGGQEINEERSQAIADAGIKEVYVRSPLNCEARKGMCRLCYGRNPATGVMVILGEAVGVMAAQSIGEPGTQLTMRTFHTGGVAGVDITSGLPRVEELFEVRSPKGQAFISEIDGLVEITEDGEERSVIVRNTNEYTESFEVPKGLDLEVSEGQWIEAGMLLARKAAEGTEAVVDLADNEDVLISGVSGRISVGKGSISVSWEENDVREYFVPPAARLILRTGDVIKAGDPITDGPLNPQDILRILGREAVQQYLQVEVQKVYRSQGVNINDKHIEVIVRQMLRKVRVESSGDTDMLPGELVERVTYEEANAGIVADGGEPGMAIPALLGVTKASLNTESFLAAASFQETARVLTEASVSGSVDTLQGLKENVIIGRLIPANLESSPEGRERLGLVSHEEDQDSTSTTQLTLDTDSINDFLEETTPGDNSVF